MRPLREFLEAPFYEKWSFLKLVYYRVKTRTFYRWVFGSMGKRCVIMRPISLHNTRFIHLGDVVGEHPTRKAEWCVVGRVDSRAKIVEWDQTDDRSKNLLVQDRVLGKHVREDRRWEERSIGDPSGDQSCAPLYSTAYQRRHAVN